MIGASSLNNSTSKCLILILLATAFVGFTELSYALQAKSKDLNVSDIIKVKPEKFRKKYLEQDSHERSLAKKLWIINKKRAWIEKPTGFAAQAIALVFPEKIEAVHKMVFDEQNAHFLNHRIRLEVSAGIDFYGTGVTGTFKLVDFIKKHQNNYQINVDEVAKFMQLNPRIVNGLAERAYIASYQYYTGLAALPDSSIRINFNGSQLRTWGIIEDRLNSYQQNHPIPMTYESLKNQPGFQEGVSKVILENLSPEEILKGPGPVRARLIEKGFNVSQLEKEFVKSNFAKVSVLTPKLAKQNLAQLTASKEEVLKAKERKLIEDIEKNVAALDKKDPSSKIEVAKAKEKIEALKRAPKQREHQRNVDAAKSNARSGAAILALVNPDLAKDMEDGLSAAIQVYDGVATMVIDGAITFDAMGTVAAGINLAIAVLSNKGPTAEEIIIDMLRDVLANQRQMLEMLYELDGKVNVMLHKLAKLDQSLERFEKNTTRNFIELKRQVDRLKFVQKDYATLLAADQKIFGLYEYIASEVKPISTAHSESDIVKCQDNWESCSKDSRTRARFKALESILHRIKTIGTITIANSLSFIQDEPIDTLKWTNITYHLSRNIGSRVGSLPSALSWLENHGTSYGSLSLRTENVKNIAHPDYFTLLLDLYVDNGTLMPQHRDAFDGDISVSEFVLQARKIEKASATLREASVIAVKVLKDKLTNILALNTLSLKNSAPVFPAFNSKETPDIHVSLKPAYKDYVLGLKAQQESLEIPFANLFKSSLREHISQSADELVSLAEQRNYHGAFVYLGNYLGMFTFNIESNPKQQGGQKHYETVCVTQDSGSDEGGGEREVCSQKPVGDVYHTYLSRVINSTVQASNYHSVIPFNYSLTVGAEMKLEVRKPDNAVYSSGPYRQVKFVSKEG